MLDAALSAISVLAFVPPRRLPFSVTDVGGKGKGALVHQPRFGTYALALVPGTSCLMALGRFGLDFSWGAYIALRCCCCLTLLSFVFLV